MPFQSEKQRRYLHANHPEIAKRWEKEYSNGGVLDIDGSEEITTEEGNDISLVDESEIGVSTLFKAKDGGTPQLAKKSKDGTRPGYRGSDWGGSSNNFSGMDSGGWDPGVSSPVDTGAVTSDAGWTGGGDQEDDVATMMSNMNITPDHSPDWTGSDRGWVVAEDDRPGEKIGIHDNRTARDRAYDFDFMYGHRIKPKDQWNEHNKRNAWTEKKQLGKELFDAFKFGIGPVSIIKFGLAQNKKKEAEKEHLQQMIDDMKAAGDTAFTPHTDTALQLAEQLMIDLNTPKKDEDTSDDGPEAPVVAPVTEEIEDSYAMAGNWLQSYRDLKAKQALSASLQEKWADEREWQQNTMFANSGGLANLFRVKN